MKPAVYLDWNAAAPLRPEARTAMAEAMDVVGNPSSVHAGGRAARALLERSRERLACALGAEPDEIVFTSGATEAAALALRGRGLAGAAIEHDCVRAWVEDRLAVDASGHVHIMDAAGSVLQAANSETGVIQGLPHGLAFVDAAQAVGKVPFDFGQTRARMASVSAQKFGGPMGVGALLLGPGVATEALLRGGGQEGGRRAGSENLIGIAGFAAAACAAVADIGRGCWDEVAEIRDVLETALEASVRGLILIGRGGRRLPNTTMLALPGWSAETQVVAMDLAGFAISAGSACSSGKARTSRVLAAMGLDKRTVIGAVRVSIGPGIGREAVLRFAEAWARAAARQGLRAA